MPLRGVGSQLPARYGSQVPGSTLHAPEGKVDMLQLSEPNAVCLSLLNLLAVSSPARASHSQGASHILHWLLLCLHEPQRGTPSRAADQVLHSHGEEILRQV